ncbi:DNA alkylation repair protein [Ferruginibacter sp. SUN002]|uniref:DNA alkylation repair protein n=1 Tax=Ferruginibacter sp. SUN002 TaxID=2937789 RepID=UPI003D36E363
MPSNEYTAIKKALLDNATPEGLHAYKKFVPGSTQKAYGVRMPVLNELAAQYKTGGFELVKELWDKAAYEEKVLAAKILGKIAKQDPAKTLQFIEYFADAIEDWAVCDTIGMQSTKLIVKTHQKEIFALATKFNTSKNFWKRRLSLVLVEWYTRDKSLHPLIKKLTKGVENDEEYYVKKAVAWIEKNFAKGK